MSARSIVSPGSLIMGLGTGFTGCCVRADPARTQTTFVVTQKVCTWLSAYADGALTLVVSNMTDVVGTNEPGIALNFTRPCGT